MCKKNKFDLFWRNWHFHRSDSHYSNFKILSLPVFHGFFFNSIFLDLLIRHRRTLWNWFPVGRSKYGEVISQTNFSQSGVSISPIWASGGQKSKNASLCQPYPWPWYKDFSDSVKFFGSGPPLIMIIYEFSYYFSNIRFFVYRTPFLCTKMTGQDFRDFTGLY